MNTNIRRHKLLADAIKRIDAAELLGVDWEVRKVRVDAGLGDSQVTLFETVVTTPPDWSNEHAVRLDSTNGTARQ